MQMWLNALLKWSDLTSSSDEHMAGYGFGHISFELDNCDLLVLGFYF